MLRVAGGLIIEHPLILPYVKEVVGYLIPMEHIATMQITNNVLVFIICILFR